jgi:hypothetical protein
MSLFPGGGLAMEVEARSELELPPPRVLNYSGVPDNIIVESRPFRELAAQLETWVNNTRKLTKGSLFDRGLYTPPENVYDEMRSARNAVRHDDIVSGVAEITEGFAFQGVKWESENADDADVFNQVNGKLNLDAVVRRMWREEFTYSTVYVAMVWGWEEFTVRGRNPAPEVGLDKVVNTDPMTGQSTEEYKEKRDPETNLPLKRGKGTKRKKKYRVWCPTQMRILDATKVVPLGIGPLGQEMYAWQATPEEINSFQAAYDGTKVDVGMTTFFVGKYTPGHDEERELYALGVDPKRLLLMNPECVFAHTMTKPDYERFADIRLKSCFGLLDLKRQLIQADRAMLIGAANYILLVRKGSKDEPGTPEEIANLKENYNFLAKLPVIISDHRLELEIIAPKTDFTLDPEKYDVLDTRILARLLGTLSLGGRGQRNETNVTLSYAVARAMENRRHMLRRTLEREVAKRMCEDTRNEGKFEDEPNLVYTPRNITLGFDSAMVQAIMNLRTQKEISRETILEYFGLDQATEAMRREIEDEYYDDIFETQVPFSSPLQAGPNGGPVAPGVAGAQGGRPAGGGTPNRNPTQAKPKTAAGNASTPKKAGGK